MGLRKQEINGLKYSDVDFVNKKLHVCRQLGVVSNSNKGDFKSKTYTKQEIPLKTKNSESTKQTKPNRVVIQHPDITPSKGKENDIQENSIPLSSIKGSSSLSKLNESELKTLKENAKKTG